MFRLVLLVYNHFVISLRSGVYSVTNLHYWFLHSYVSGDKHVSSESGDPRSTY